MATVTSTNTELLPLLQRLATLAPEVCSYKRTHFLLNGLNRPFVVTDVKTLTTTDYAILQAAVQEAIAAHGWHWQVCNIDEDGFEGEVSNPQERDPSGLTGVVHLRDAANPAIALLLAFLQALEAAQ